MCGRVAELSHARKCGVRGLLGGVGNGDGSGAMTNGHLQKRGHDCDLDVEGGRDVNGSNLLHVISSWAMQDLSGLKRWPTKRHVHAYETPPF
jgi:hypothetical protein